jgi:hypothetical protein
MELEGLPRSAPPYVGRVSLGSSQSPPGLFPLGSSIFTSIIFFRLSHHSPPCSTALRKALLHARVHPPRSPSGRPTVVGGGVGVRNLDTPPANAPHHTCGSSGTACIVAFCIVASQARLNSRLHAPHRRNRSTVSNERSATSTRCPKFIVPMCGGFLAGRLCLHECTSRRPARVRHATPPTPREPRVKFLKR